MFSISLVSCMISLAATAIIASTANGADYDQTTAFNALYFSYVAPCSEEVITAWDCYYCELASEDFNVSFVTSKTFSRAFIGYDESENKIVLSFRGTVNQYGWICDDFNIIQQAYPEIEDAYIHRGFYDVWVDPNQNYKELFMPYIIELLDTAVAKSTQDSVGCEFLITGHSLGAALAQVAALTVVNYTESMNISCDVSVIDFGSPRWANEVLVDWLDARLDTHWRLVNEKDPVPQVPFVDWGTDSKYHHAATEIWYENSTLCEDDGQTSSESGCEWKVCDGSGEDPTCSASLDINNIFELIADTADDGLDHLHYLGQNALDFNKICGNASEIMSDIENGTYVESVIDYDDYTLNVNDTIADAITSDALFNDVWSCFVCIFCKNECGQCLAGSDDSDSGAIRMGVNYGGFGIWTAIVLVLFASFKLLH